MAARNVPAEIWGKIFELSCTDGGQTGRSLALVSTYIHAVSRPYQYLSVSITGKNAIAQFANLLAQDTECRRVKFLFMSTIDPSPELRASSSCPEHPAEIPSISDVDATVRDPNGHCKTLNDMYRVLEFVAPSLRILHVVMDFHRQEIFLPIQFPVLEELTMQGPFHDHVDCSDEFFDTLYPTLPSLRRLFLTDVFTCIDDRTYLALEHYAPYLTHLKMQSADGYVESSRTFLRQLSRHNGDEKKNTESYVGHEWNGVKKTNKQPRFPETLQRVLFHMGPTQTAGFFGTMYLLRSIALRELEKVTKEDSRIVLFKDSTWKHPHSRVHSCVEGKGQWLQRIAGGRGHWEDRD
ncbi:hypothetical protein Agabi119p4_6922 [Agaricus bisporus var. burnettii]|uniref:Uncharacterized protein n=1 Tax=Agaricus bisporus var. burnettii TaxID=192524 RepID=A0A8H7F0F9_AGABI|nr:hypothetical protein Agabi119p4_6922 [Agaricus bisporus var. burnettii]